MLKIDFLQTEMVKALKQGDKMRKQVLSELIDACRKAAVPKSANDNKKELTDTFVNDVLIKHQKTIQEMIDTCPDSRKELKENYLVQLNIVKEYTPQLISDKNTIVAFIKDVINDEYGFTKNNKGIIMKIVSPLAKGIYDMKSVSIILNEMLV